jgi:hypothetical protein
MTSSFNCIHCIKSIVRKRHFHEVSLHRQESILIRHLSPKNPLIVSYKVCFQLTLLINIKYLQESEIKEKKKKKEEEEEEEEEEKEKEKRLKHLKKSRVHTT